MKIIRGRLSAADVSNPLIRYNPDTDVVEFTPDGGATWTPAPSLDIRHSPMFLKPPVAGSSKRCDAAANMVKWFKDFIDTMLFDFELVGSVTTIINSILLSLSVVTEGFTSFLALISELAESISVVGATALAAAFTSTEYDLLLCIFYCHTDADGRISAEELVGVQDDITVQLNTTAAVITNFILFIQGEIGLSNAGAIGSETGDCSACECGWCWTDDLNDVDGGITALTSDGWGGGAPAAVYSPPWESVLLLRDSPFIDQADFYRVTKELPPGRYTSIKIEYNATFDLPGGFTAEVALNIYVGMTQIANLTNGGSGDQVIEWTGDRDDLTGLNILSILGFASGHAPSGFLSHTRITYKGFGDNPFGDDNCE